MEFHFYLEKNLSGQNQSSRTVSTIPVKAIIPIAEEKYQIGPG